MNALFEGGGAQQGLPALERLLRSSADAPRFSEGAVSLEVLEELHALMAVGPGMSGASPTQVLFIATPAARARLAQRLAPRARTAAVVAPVCAVVGYDRQFAEQLIAFVGDGVAGVSCFDRPGALRAAAMRNSVLQGAYLTLSARALGLEVQFLHGFDGAAVAGEFFQDPSVTAIFVAALGYPCDLDA
ncbi:nitroreductase family protein [Phenylobacterium sp.]|uniref:nitroreductase family protein n=1 Tax=Phenylobacterium sp. TaxID=1871053 RepID=UPI003562FA04